MVRSTTITPTTLNTNPLSGQYGMEFIITKRICCMLRNNLSTNENDWNDSLDWEDNVDVHLPNPIQYNDDEYDE